MGVWAYGSTGPTGYDYVQAGQPSNPEEGETWYDVDADAAFVYDGSTWVEMTVTGHGQLSNVSAGQHRSDSNIRTVVDGSNISITGDADTVDGKHANDLGASLTFKEFSQSSDSGTKTVSAPSGTRWLVPFVRIESTGFSESATVTLYYDNGNSSSYSGNGKTVQGPHRGDGVYQIDLGSDSTIGSHAKVLEVPV